MNCDVMQIFIKLNSADLKELLCCVKVMLNNYVLFVHTSYSCVFTDRESLSLWVTDQFQKNCL